LEGSTDFKKIFVNICMKDFDKAAKILIQLRTIQNSAPLPNLLARKFEYMQQLLQLNNWTLPRTLEKEVCLLK
jgi:hypothetical protein